MGNANVGKIFTLTSGIPWLVFRFSFSHWRRIGGTTFRRYKKINARNLRNCEEIETAVPEQERRIR